jgi:hypothetical protein
MGNGAAMHGSGAVQPVGRILVLVTAVTVLTSAGAPGQESPHGKLQIECNTCHTTDSWKITGPIAFKHETTNFALTGRHKAVRCESCHTSPGNLAAFSCTTGCHQTAHHQGENCYSCHKNA